MPRFVNFKGFADASLIFNNPFTLLIGKNGSGKSNAIEGLELLAELAAGRPLFEVADVGRAGPGAFKVRGGLLGCARSGETGFSLGITARFCRYEVVIRPGPEPRVFQETLDYADEKKNVFQAQLRGRSGILNVTYNNFARGGNKPTIARPADRTFLSQYVGFAASHPKLAPAAKRVAALQAYVRALFVFDPQPKAMREYERIGNRVLARDGSNLSAVLFGLFNGTDEEKESLARILRWVQQLPEEPYEAFQFIVTDLHDVMLGLKEAGRPNLTDARLLSDGTLRCLAVLAALETAAPSSRVVIEEYDNGVHPSRVGVLNQAIADCCKRRKLNVLCTTHNPATLDALTPEQLKGVVLCFWDRRQQASRLVPLLDLPRADVLLERGQLGDLVTRRVLEQHLLPDFEEEQERKAREWLDSLP